MFFTRQYEQLAYKDHPGIIKPDYSKGKIYKLVSSNFDKCYIGSTCHSLERMKREHEYYFKKFQKTPEKRYAKTWVQIFEAGGIISIHLLENFSCQTEAELLERKNYYINTEKCVNNQFLMELMPLRKDKD